ncbi:uncharacterized protein LOC126852294 [Cataglyphis hispanica]|uniref:uncharacterized protein LOC126852294 n=1 Tax=Cataglyphis hispanica TaxID=1086592 RepID=UPI00217F9656|nr:uncharacterized protein LOC126852294 [Cataglyphis hispanica]
MEIATEMKKAKYNVTVAQCQNKMSGLKRTYKNISDSNKKSDNHLSSWAFYSVMDSIFGEKAWIAPVSIASSDGPSRGSSLSILTETLTIDEPKSKKRRVESIFESFITEIKDNKQKEREDGEQRRAERRAEKENKVEIKLNKKNWKCTKRECSFSSL